MGHLTALGRIFGIAAVVLALSFALPAIPGKAASPSGHEPFAACVDRIAPKMNDGKDLRGAMWDAANLCQTLITAARADDEQQIRADNFVFQRSENSVLMWMVVSITLGGVILAAAQLWGSYNLAKMGRASLPEGGSVDLSKDKLAVQSSVVGVIVLAISFAFFMVFVLYVYTLKDASQAKLAAAVDSSETAHQLSSGPLQPVPNTK